MTDGDRTQSVNGAGIRARVCHVAITSKGGSSASKIVHPNPPTPTTNHKNKWETNKPMDKYYVTIISYPKFVRTINVVFVEDTRTCDKQ